MNVSGNSSPRVGCFHRARTSWPTVSEVSRSTRLVVGNDLSRFDGAVHFRLKLDALLQSFVRGAVEEAVLTGSLRLCPIHGHVRLPQRGFDIGAVTLGHRIIAVGTWIAGGDAHAYANLERQGGKRYRL
jgi:hypothetical protein